MKNKIILIFFAILVMGCADTISKKGKKLISPLENVQL